MVGARVLKLKLKRWTGFWRGLALWACLAAPAQAEPSHTVLWMQDSAGSQPRLLAAVRIQLSDVASVAERTWTRSRALPERITEANALAARERVAAVVWVEASAQQTLLYVVGRRAGRALVEVLDAPADGSAERIVALKLSELLSDAWDSERPLLEPSEVRKAPAPKLPAAETSWRWRGILGAGARVSAALDAPLTRVGLGMLAAAQVQNANWLLGLGLGVDGYPGSERTRRGSLVQLREVAPRVRAEAGKRWHDTTLSVHGGLALLLLDSTGRSERGHVGEQSARSVAWLVGLGLDRELTRWLSARAFVDLTVQAQRQLFEVNGATVLDLGRVQLGLGLELALHLPTDAP